MKPIIVTISRSITRKQGAGKIDPRQERILLRQLDGWIESIHRPCVVLNCSELDGIGVAEIRLLVSCLERVLKNQGDARLAGLSAQGREILAYAGADRLFRIYESIESAVRSFDSHPLIDGQGEYRSGGLRQPTGDDKGSISPALIHRYAGRKLGDTNE